MTHNMMKLQGPWEVRRRFKVTGLSDFAGAERLEKTLAEVEGVCAVVADVAKHLVRVRYEITRTDSDTIRAALEAAGFHPLDGVWARWKYQWFQFVDVTGRDNAGVKPSPCCNKVPVARR
jgi:copper chaperone CopZ